MQLLRCPLICLESVVYLEPTHPKTAAPEGESEKKGGGTGEEETMELWTGNTFMFSCKGSGKKQASYLVLATPSLPPF